MITSQKFKIVFNLTVHRLLLRRILIFFNCFMQIFYCCEKMKFFDLANCIHYKRYSNRQRDIRKFFCLLFCILKAKCTLRENLRTKNVKNPIISWSRISKIFQKHVLNECLMFLFKQLLLLFNVKQINRSFVQLLFALKIYLTLFPI